MDDAHLELAKDPVFVLPTDLKDWSISTINSLVSLKYPESDTLDFKEEVSELEKDICGFANSSGGFLVLGIRGKDRAEEKKPFGDEHAITQQVTGKLALIEPTPVTASKTISEEEGCYIILKIINAEHRKPFIVKNKGSFYVRLNDSTQPASRAIILNLFSDNVGRRQKLTVLKNAIEILNNELTLRVKKSSFEVTTKFGRGLPEIDLSFVKSSIVNAVDLVFDMDETGKVGDKLYTSGLLTTIIPKLEEANANIRAFNDKAVGSKEREDVATYVREFGREIPTMSDDLSKFKIAITKMLD